MKKLDEIVRQFLDGKNLEEDELMVLYDNFLYDEEIYDVGDKNTIIYQIILKIGDKYYAGYMLDNDCWGMSWDLSRGFTRVYPKEKTIIYWSEEEN